MVPSFFGGWLVAWDRGSLLETEDSGWMVDSSRGNSRLCKGVFVTTASQPFTSALIMSNPSWFKYELIYEKNKGESPERVLLSDKPLLAAVVLWAVMVVGILYVFVS